MNINEIKNIFRRQYWEDKAQEAWVASGNTLANSSPKNPTQNDHEYDAFRHAYTIVAQVTIAWMVVLVMTALTVVQETIATNSVLAQVKTLLPIMNLQPMK